MNSGRFDRVERPKPLPDEGRSPGFRSELLEIVDEGQARMKRLFAARFAGAAAPAFFSAAGCENSARQKANREKRHVHIGRRELNRFRNQGRQREGDGAAIVRSHHDQEKKNNG